MNVWIKKMYYLFNGKNEFINSPNEDVFKLYHKLLVTSLQNNSG